MNLLSAIRHHYNLRLAPITQEFEVKWFRIDDSKLGFCVRIGNGGIFGCLPDDEVFACIKGEWRRIEFMRRPFSGEMKKEWLIWQMGRSMVEMSDDDSERYQVAVDRVSKWF